MPDCGLNLRAQLHSTTCHAFWQLAEYRIPTLDPTTAEDLVARDQPWDRRGTSVGVLRLEI